MAVSLYFLKRYNEALNCINKGLKINPKNANLYYIKGIVLGVWVIMIMI